jgi:hypothetical protein
MEAMRQTWSDDRLDVLNEKVDHGFRLVDERFKLVDQRFEQVEGRLDRIEHVVLRLDDRMERLEARMTQFSLAVVAAMTVGFLANIAVVLIAAG